MQLYTVTLPSYIHPKRRRVFSSTTRDQILSQNPPTSALHRRTPATKSTLFYRGKPPPPFTGKNHDKPAVRKNGNVEEDLSSAQNWGKREDQREIPSILQQMKAIVAFSGPATALWICGPLMSLIDTAIIGQKSSTELAALGPGTVLCDNMSYVFMFLSIATSNIIATAVAKNDRKRVQHQLSILLFVGLTMGLLMSVSMKCLGPLALRSFTGAENAHLVPLANTYVHIRSFAWPAVLVGWVAQSASLGMKDSWGPLKSLLFSSTVNVVAHIVLCTWMGYGIAGAAWATMASQTIAAYLMLQGLERKGYTGLSFSPSSIVVPSMGELVNILKISAPVFVTMASKVGFYSLIIYMATSMGTTTVAAHQVMIQLYSMCVVWGEPLSQTAQSFMPELMYGGVEEGAEKARVLLRSLMAMGVVTGVVVGGVGTGIAGGFPRLFTGDEGVRREMRRVLVPFFVALGVTPCTHSVEGTLLAGREVGFMSMVMSGCLVGGMALLMVVRTRGYGLVGCWCALVVFQWGRFLLSLTRLMSPTGILYGKSGENGEDDLKQ